jgi:hypothetical protein
MARDPRIEQLEVKLAGCRDDEADHIPWVGHDGVVHIEPLPEGMLPHQWESQNRETIKFRYETYSKGVSVRRARVSPLAG